MNNTILSKRTYEAVDQAIFDNFTADECIEYLSKHYGLRGFGGTSITKRPDQQTTENLRRECICQSKISKLEDQNSSFLELLKKAKDTIEYLQSNIENKKTHFKTESCANWCISEIQSLIKTLNDEKQ